MEQNKLLVILGPTASGKTKLAVGVADAMDAEIISADSRQVFSGMDIGTGKDLNEYVINGKDIPYHLIDIKNAGDKYNVNQFKEDFYGIYTGLRQRNKTTILCGGTGMYIHSLLQNHEYTSIPVDADLRSRLLLLDKDQLRTILRGYSVAFTGHADQSSVKRIIRAIEIAEYLSSHEFITPQNLEIKPVVIGLTSDVAKRRARILDRLDVRLEQGMIDEVKILLEGGVSREMLTFYGLEYKFVVAYLFKEITYSELREKLGIAICQFAKRQMTFFRKMEKDGIKINWLETDAEQAHLIAAVISLYQDGY